MAKRTASLASRKEKNRTWAIGPMACNKAGKPRHTTPGSVRARRMAEQNREDRKPKSQRYAGAFEAMRGY